MVVFLASACLLLLSLIICSFLREISFMVLVSAFFISRIFYLMELMSCLCFSLY